MTKEVAKKGIDLLFKMYDEDNKNMLINKNTIGIIIEFIGGEPFMNVDLIDYASDYFLNQCIEKNHPWQDSFRFNFSTNGMLYFEDKVQAYLKKFRPFISLSITVDGPKEMHDACRKDYDGNGSFDKAIAALTDWHKTEIIPETKVTISPDNIMQLHKIVNFFIKYNCTIIHANPIFEHDWTIEECKIYYEQLKLVADSLLKYPEIESNLFDPKYGRPMPSDENGNWCGGTGAMLAFDPEGKAYPCLRYMESSLGNKCKPIIIGDVNGIYKTQDELNIQKQLTAITRRSQSTDECFNCQIASGCSWCSAWNYQKYGTPNKKDTGICWAQRARSLVNSYYCNKKYIQQNSERRVPVFLNRELALQLIDDKEYNMLLKLSTEY